MAGSAWTRRGCEANDSNDVVVEALNLKPPSTSARPRGDQMWHLQPLLRLTSSRDLILRRGKSTTYSLSGSNIMAPPPSDNGPKSATHGS
ncbi:uncharacterized protein UV8b_08068 [Ustilaginoidea virens]|uniref:Uncharacterized protein n=1 Tax=Ustilaginoidea virens TaxID=1159556 RepID=A0A8E5MLK3_USTVR|nr:uncharacterized protein UV8b_08068 [Ustilaginoidea virens]QUC23827.1 hypothetical protein UV8b_08068 [Ustilaginoidea virens]